MRLLRTLLPLIFVLFIHSAMKSQTGLIMKELNGTETGYLLSDIRKISFPPAEVKIEDTGNGFHIYPVNSISRITFGTVSSNKEDCNLLQSTYISLYPNPANDILHVVLPNSSKKKDVINLSDIRGRKVCIDDNYYRTDSGWDINVSTLKPGIYFINISSNNQMITKKFIKN